eukprot:3469822-Amphidinium_carterae.1
MKLLAGAPFARVCVVSRPQQSPCAQGQCPVNPTNMSGLRNAHGSQTPTRLSPHFLFWGWCNRQQTILGEVSWKGAISKEVEKLVLHATLLGLRGKLEF